MPQRVLGELFEHYVGNELIHYALLQDKKTKVRYWRDSAGPEVDFVLEQAQIYTPIEVKWTDKPSLRDVQHLEKFMQDYPNTDMAYLVCRTPRRYQLAAQITALPWCEIASLFSDDLMP